MQISLENISKKFSEVNAVENLNIKIDDGELVSILGPSGCGKSTTLFLIAGLEEVTGGKIFFGDEDVTKVDSKNRGIGMVFQNYALYPHMTVYENIEFPLKMAKMKKDLREKKVLDMAKLVKIDELLDRKPSKLSGGQQQRVAIARALVKEPKILLLDEPLSNLDARLRIEMREEISRIQKEIGITTIFVTHDQEEAMSISDKILLMKDGKLQQYSNPRDMYLNPTNKFVAKFLGNPKINIFDGKETEGGFITDKNTYFKFEKEKSEIRSIGIRPEDFKICSKDEMDLEVEIKSIQTMGKELYVKGLTKGGDEFVFTSSWDEDLQLNQTTYLKIRKIYEFVGE